MKKSLYICNAKQPRREVITYKNTALGVSSVSHIASHCGCFAAKSEGTLSFCTYIFNRKTC